MSSNKGLTLVELLTVVVLIGIMVSITLGIAGYASRKSAESKARADILQILNALEEFRLTYGVYPRFDPSRKTDEAYYDPGAYSELSTSYVLSDDKRLTMNLTTNFNEQFKDLTFTDPWLRGYKYDRLGLYSYRVWSDGPNRDNLEDNIDSSRNM